MKKNNKNILILREKKNSTFKPVAAGIEKFLFKPLKILEKD